MPSNSSIVCSNPECREVFNREKTQKQILKHGLGFSHCGDILFQVVKCHIPSCGGRMIIRCKIPDTKPVSQFDKSLPAALIIGAIAGFEMVRR